MLAASITIYAGGSMKGTPYEKIVESYKKRIHIWSIHIKEVSYEMFQKLVPAGTQQFMILHEHGEQLSSLQFYHKLTQCLTQGKKLVFLVGCARGFPASLLAQPHKSIALGHMTWPHLMARLLLLEQIYRAQQYEMRHPYSFI